MKVVPVKNAMNPGYPTKLQSLEDPVLLQNIPMRWKQIAVVMTAVSSLSITSCSPAQENINYIFGKGKSQQLMGRVAIARINLSEKEAIDIIADELSKQGLTADIKSIKDIKADVPTKYEYIDTGMKIGIKNTSITLDGIIEGENIGFEYISNGDMNEWLGKTPDEYVHDDILNVYKESIDNNIIEDNDMKTVMLYSEYSNSRQEAEDNLRSQVNDFINWLKEQGII